MMTDTPTPAPTLTDEQIDQDALMTVPAGTVVHAADGTIAARYDETRGVVFGDERPFPWSVLRAPATVLWPRDLAAVVARAKREAAEEIADELSRSIHEVRGTRREYLSLEHADDATTRSAWDQSRAETCRRISNELNRIVREASYA